MPDAAGASLLPDAAVGRSAVRSGACIVGSPFLSAPSPRTVA